MTRPVHRRVAHAIWRVVSLPAMLAEMEIAWPRLREGGILVVDVLSWTDAWDRWLGQRDATVREHGRLAEDVGYAVRGAGG